MNKRAQPRMPAQNGLPKIRHKGAVFGAQARGKNNPADRQVWSNDMPTELIVGGDFESPGFGGGWTIVDNYGSWSGNRFEVGQHSLYHSGASSSNTVIELDGNGGSEVTVLEQTFTVDSAGQTGTLSFDAGGRNTSFANDPVAVDVVDASGATVFSQTVTPTSVGSFDTFNFDFTFPAAGDYTLRFTEQGSNNSLGTILDNISLMVCFTKGTRISTPNGDVPVEELQTGDLVFTIDGTAKPVKWIAARTLTAADLQRCPEIRPITFQKGSLGKDMPRHDLSVSPQHRILIRSKVAERVVGQRETLVPAKKLTTFDGVSVDTACQSVTYVHFALQEHDVVKAEGAFAETLYFGQQALQVLGQPAVKELQAIFPEICDFSRPPKPARGLDMTNAEMAMLQYRLTKNEKPLVEGLT